MRTTAAYSVICVIALLVAIMTRANTAPSNIALGVLLGFLAPLVDAVIRNSDRLPYIWIAVRYRNERVRLSISYLYRIKVDERYLLVRGGRYSQFQPVGGVYKSLPTAASFLGSVKALGDNLIAIDDVSASDLRIRVPARYVPKFVEWFDSEQDREFGPWREFFEELVAPGHLPASSFHFVQQRYLGRRISRLRDSAWAQSKEMFIADIFELVPDRDQELLLRQLLGSTSPELKWVTEDQIRRLGAVPGAAQTVPIAETAVWVLDA